MDYTRQSPELSTLSSEDDIASVVSGRADYDRGGNEKDPIKRVIASFAIGTGACHEDGGADPQQ